MPIKVQEFDMDVSVSKSTVNVTMSMPRKEFEQLMKVLHDRKLMAPICRAIDNTALGRALIGSTYCAQCKNQYGQIAESHQFSAKNWGRAAAEAFWYCKGSFSMSRGKCTTAYGQVIKHD